MALNTYFRLPANATPIISDDLVTDVPFQITTSTTTTDPNYLAQNDIAELFKLPPNYLVVGAMLSVGASGSATQWTVGIADDDGSGTNYAAVTTATTANTAMSTTMSVAIADPSTSQKIVAVKITGAAVLTAADVRGIIRIGHKFDLGMS